MRTVILLAALIIKDAINKNPMEKEAVAFIAWVLVIIICMDIIEFIHKITRPKWKNYKHLQEFYIEL